MSICAEIIGSECFGDGTVGIALGPIGDDGPGQACLICVNPPLNVDAFRRAILGQKIWGSADTIMVRDTVWAKREGYTRIRLVESADAEPSIAQIRQELAQAGWVERNSTTYIAPNGHWYRGPYGAWKVMKQLAADATTESKEPK